jgi:hypothetical protein
MMKAAYTVFVRTLRRLRMGWVDGTGSGLCPMVGFGISGVEPEGLIPIELADELHGITKDGRM